MAKEICEDYGKVFEAGPKAFLCPSCRKRRLSNAAKARGLNRIGTAACRKDGQRRREKMRFEIENNTEANGVQA